MTNPDYRSPNEGEVCGGGFNLEHGHYTLIYEGGNLVRHYDDGFRHVELSMSTQPVNQPPNWNAIMFVTDAKPRRFRLTDDGQLIPL